MICYKIATCVFIKLNNWCKIFFMNKNPEKIKEMFNKIANVYDFNNKIISFGLHKKIKKLAIEIYPFSGTCLDLCTGTGDIAGFLSSYCEVIGVDFSKNMLEIARKKHPKIKFLEEDCTNLSFENNSFDNITISFGLRNIENYDLALDEIYRILKPKGKFLHLDFCKNNPLADIFYDFLIPKLVKIFYKDNVPYEYLIKSKQLFFDEKNLIELFKKHNLKLIKQKKFLFGTIACQLCEKET